jgi:hypothetical protein
MIKRLGGLFFSTLLFFLAYRFAVRHYLATAGEEATDFPSYYYGAKLAFDLNTAPYSNAAWNIAKKQYLPGELFPFLYPPPSLLFFRLFNLLEYQSAKLLMLGSNHAFAVIFVLLFFFGILKQKIHEPFPMAGVIYFYNFYPLALTVDTGQINILILILICLTWMAIRARQRAVLIALPLALGIVLKLYPALFIMVLIFRREYKSAAYAIAFALVASIIAALLLPKDIWIQWYQNVATKGYLAQDVLKLAVGKPADQSINAFLIRLFFGLNVRFPPLLSPPSWVVQLSPYVLCGFVGIVSISAVWRSYMESNKENLNLQFCVGLLAMFLIAPISWDHHLVLILPAIYIAFLESFKHKWYLALPVLAVLAYFLSINFDFNNPAFREGWKTLLISAKLYAVVILWVFFAVLSFIKSPPVQNESDSSILE